MPSIWSATAYDLLYGELVRQFDPLWKWETQARPGRGLDEKFDAFCKAFAELVGAESARAVEMQIAYARMGTVPNASAKAADGRSAMLNFILNKAAAYHAGFIRRTDVPPVKKKREDR